MTAMPPPVPIGRTPDGEEVTLPSTNTSTSTSTFFTVGGLGHGKSAALPLVPADQRWFWDPKWLAGEAEASAEIAAGGLKVYDSMEELFAELDGSTHDDDGPAGATT